jgi:Flp pilus assembly protein TadG
MLAVAIVVLVLFAGLAIDFSIAYTLKSGLSRAVDASALEGMRALSQGNTVAQQVATDSFNANVQALGSMTIPPTLSFVQNTDASGNQSVTITGTVSWQPLFLRLVYASPILISDSATVGRAPLYMTLVLDQSYSMTQNGGSTALAPAVNAFVGQFNDTADHVAVVSFASIATIGVQMSNSPPFKLRVFLRVRSRALQAPSGVSSA